MREVTGSSPVSSTTKTPRAARLWGFSHAIFRAFSLIGLSCGNRLNKLLHAAGTIPAHLGGDMTVNVQSESRRCVGKYQIVFRPAFPGLYPHSVLLQSLELKQTEPEQSPGFYCSWVGRSSIDRPFSVPAEAAALLGRVNIREKYEEIKECFPKQRKPAKISKLEVLNAVLYVVENGCKWRRLPKEYRDWHVIYVRVNRWAKKGVLQEAFSPVSTDTGVLRASAKTGKSPCAIWQDDVK